MKIVILNGNTDPNNKSFDEYLVNLSLVLDNENNAVRVLQLRDLRINHCTGCFNCWYKTPGLCILKDDMREVCREYINSDFVIFASPIIMGFTSSLLKRTTDRLIPLGQPYGDIVKGKFIHVKRYFQYPSLGLILDNETDSDEDVIKMINNLYRDISIIFFSKLMFTNFLGKPVNEIADEITHC